LEAVAFRYAAGLGSLAHLADRRRGFIWTLRPVFCSHPAGPFRTRDREQEVQTMRLSSNRLFALAACLFMAHALAFAASGAPRRTIETARTAKIKRHQATGEILSISPTTLVLLHARGRGHQRMIFHLTAQTKETVAVAKGNRVTVLYVLEDGRMDAVRIRAPKTGKR
jgi:hypothetical protein